MASSLKSASHFLKWSRQYQLAFISPHLCLVAMDTSLSGLCFLLSRPAYDRLRCFLLWCLCLHSTLLSSNTNQRLPPWGLQCSRPEMLTETQSTPWAKLHRMLPQRPMPTNTSLLPSWKGKYSDVIFSWNKLIIRRLLLKSIQRREDY